VHLVGFIIGIYHDARSPERQIACSNAVVLLGIIPHPKTKLTMSPGTSHVSPVYSAAHTSSGAGEFQRPPAE